MMWWLISAVLIFLWVAAAVVAALVIGRAITRADRLERTEPWWSYEYDRHHDHRSGITPTHRDARPTHRAA